MDDATRSMLNGATVLSDTVSVGEKVDRLRRMLQMYSPTFDVVFNPQGKQIGQNLCRFAILESPPGMKPYIIRYLSDADLENPVALRDWVAAGDTRRHRPKDILARIEQTEAIKRAETKRLQAEKVAESDDFVASAVRGGINKLHTYKHNGRRYE